MAREKKIKRTIIVGYKYEVLEKKGTVVTVIGELTNAEAIRSVKEGKKVLLANNFDEECILVPAGMEQRVYEMPESTFMQHATIVSEEI